jgi:hypothetical protein
MARVKRWVEDPENEAQLVINLFFVGLLCITLAGGGALFIDLLQDDSGGVADGLTDWQGAGMIVGFITLLTVTLIAAISSLRASAGRGQWVWFAMCIAFFPVAPLVYWIFDEMLDWWD